MNDAQYRRKALEAWQREQEQAKESLSVDYSMFRRKTSSLLHELSDSMQQWLHHGKTNH